MAIPPISIATASLAAIWDARIIVALAPAVLLRCCRVAEMNECARQHFGMSPSGRASRQGCEPTARLDGWERSPYPSDEWRKLCPAPDPRQLGRRSGAGNRRA